VKRVAVGLLALGLAGAGALSAAVLAGTGHVLETTESTATATETTAPAPSEPQTTTATTAETLPPTTAPPTTVAPRPKPTQLSQRLPDGVRIAGVHVGGLGPDAAYQAVRLAFESPLDLLANGRRIEISASRLGAVAYVKAAVAEARHVAPRAAVPLFVRIDRRRVTEYVASLAKQLERDPVDSSVVLRNLAPVVKKGASGWALDRASAVRKIVSELVANRRSPILLPLRKVKPKLAAAAFPIVVIRRSSNALLLYRGAKLDREFHVATGQSAYPTPLGRFEVVVKWQNPWWYPPSSPWAKGAKPIPPGPGNPLGTRWMGLSSPGVGIHGTPDAASIGYSLSHGCIRMLIPDAEWLFDHVEIGTPVFIVAA
jgi:lipoprotein-anchoring transpeptidase ErfK/SrfK